eukprot:7452730-Lingulodinium_polyedra.AAC.1
MRLPDIAKGPIGLWCWGPWDNLPRVAFPWGPTLPRAPGSAFPRRLCPRHAAVTAAAGHR